MRRGRSALGRIFGTLVMALLAARGVGAQTFQPINSFTGCVAAGCSVGTDGARPASTLVAGPGGDFYGTTYGFPGSLGSVYRVSPSGARTTLVNFDEPQDPVVFGPSGAFPVGRLALGADGNLYGVTDGGGLNNGGVLFRVSSGGAFDVLHHFPTGFAPSGGPVFTADGDLFGVTANGGDANQGTVFKWDGSSVTTIYSFGTSAGAYPSGDLMLASDGHVYGAAPGGGGFAVPTLFRITPAETVEPFHTFTATEGVPNGGLLEASDGQFYGTTLSGLYRITPASVLTPLHNFIYFRGNLIEGFGGVIYGTTYSGGTSNMGTIFRMTPDGSLTTLHSFSGADGRQPDGGLVRGADRHIYGTAYAGGTDDLGVFFRLGMPPAVDVTANGGQGPLPLSGAPLTIRFAFEVPGTGLLNPAHMLAGVATPFGVLWLGPAGFSLTPVLIYSGPLPTFGPAAVFNLPSTAGLPAGTYHWFMLVIDGAANTLIGDAVQTTISPPS